MRLEYSATNHPRAPPQVLEAHDVDVRLEYSNNWGAYRTVRLDYFIRGARLNGAPRVSNSHFSYSLFPSSVDRGHGYSNSFNSAEVVHF